MKSLLHSLVWLLPAEFRADFGAEISEQIDRDYTRAAQRGWLAALGFVLATALDLIGSAVAERIRPAGERGPGGSGTRGGDGIMRDVMRDMYFAGRGLRRAPGFSATAILTLGAAIGLNAAMFAVVERVLLDPLPFAEPDRLIYIGASAPGSDLPDEFGVSNEFVVEYSAQTDLLEDAGTFDSFTNTLRVGDRVERVLMSMPTSSMFTTLGVEPMLGRLPVARDESETMVISHAAWVDWFGADPSVVGQSHEVAGGTRTIVGVMPADFAFPDAGVHLWIPREIRPDDIVPGRFGPGMVARLAPGVTLDEVTERLGAIARRFPEQYGGSASYARLMRAHIPVVRPLEEQLVGFVTAPLWVLFGAVVIVFLIACANVTNLFVVRSERRLRDLAVRRAIGAGWAQLARLQLAEAIVIAFGAGALAVGLAWVGLPLFLRAAPDGVPRLEGVALSGSALFFTFGICALTAVLCGLPMALRRPGSGTALLRGGGARGSTSPRSWMRDLLVVGQTALALTLLVGSGLLLRSFDALRSVDAGYEVEDVFTFQIAVDDEPGLDGATQLARFHLDFMDRLRALPGVESVGLVENVPLNEGVRVTAFATRATEGESDARVQLGRTWTAGDYFESMGIELVQGRTFDDAEQLDNPGSVIVSEAAAALLWPGEEPLGQQLLWPSFETWETVVGVVEDIRQYDFRTQARPMVYFPLVAQNPENWAFSSPGYVLKTGRAEEIGPEVRDLVREVAPSAPMYRAFTLERLADDSMVGLRFTMLTLGVASVLALFLGVIGLYGVLSYAVAERTREIGVRMALGARADGVRRMVVAQGLRVVSFGVLVGLVASFAVTRTLASLLFQVEPVDPLTFLLVASTVMGVGAVASYLPARRASRVDPVESLRNG